MNGALKLATSIGMTISEFWEVTPYELSLVAEGYNKRQEIEGKERIYQAYLISRFVWQKKIDIEKLLEDKKEKKIMTDEQMLNQVKALNSLFGGEVKN